MPSVPAAWGSRRAPRPQRTPRVARRVDGLELGVGVGQPRVDADRSRRGRACRPRRRACRRGAPARRRRRAGRAGGRPGGRRRRPRSASGRRAGGAGRPRPEHGASTSTRSNDPGRNGGRRPSATTTGTRVGGPVRPALPATSPARAGADVGGHHARRPSPASAVALPPGAAQRSATRSPGRGPDQAATHCEARSCM